MDNKSYSFVFWHMQLYMSWYIRSCFGFTLYILYYFKHSCTNIFHRRSLFTFYSVSILCMYIFVCMWIHFLVTSVLIRGVFWNILLDRFNHFYWKPRCLIPLIMEGYITTVNANDVNVFLVMFVWINGTGTALITEDYRRLRLTMVPENLNTDVEALILKFNKIHTITNCSLANYHNLVTLDMEYNMIKYIYEGAFDSNANLQFCISRITGCAIFQPTSVPQSIHCS